MPNFLTLRDDLYHTVIVEFIFESEKFIKFKDYFTEHEQSLKGRTVLANHKVLLALFKTLSSNSTLDYCCANLIMQAWHENPFMLTVDSEHTL